MDLSGKFKFLGTESGVSNAGKPYVRLGILQGLKSEVLYPADDIIEKVKNIQPMTDIICNLSINIKDDKTAYVGIKDIIIAPK
ncbi:hypothetical protein [Sedimentibacter sp.]|uniref:hypothetical protein n=1 Tax=Sedimentibacter sp. TaxID=1960295 RepID=UPI0028A72812|nr:hypothetical protein [Sedimentibacter sp.]